MANGSFARGTESINSDASIAFEGNTFRSVSDMLRTTNLFEPFPDGFNNDSALHYLYRCKELAEKESDTGILMGAYMRLAHQYVVTGYYPEAQLYFQKVQPRKLPNTLLPTYYHYLSHLYRELEMFTIDKDMHDEYHRLSSVYRDSLEQISDPNTVLSLQRRCIALCADGNYRDLWQPKRE